MAGSLLIRCCVRFPPVRALFSTRDCSDLDLLLYVSAGQPVIDELIMTAIAKDPNARPPTMEAFGERIAAILATLPVDGSASTQQSAVLGVPGMPSTLAPSGAGPASYAPVPGYVPTPGIHAGDHGHPVAGIDRTGSL